MAELGFLQLVSYLSINKSIITENLDTWVTFSSKFSVWRIRREGISINRILHNNYFLEEGIDLSDLRCLSGLSYIENSGNYVAFSPEFSNGQFLKTSNTINRIVHIKGGEKKWVLRED